ncbi:MAG: hypothetical protein QM730_09260 [Anaerolineales bacterium]
MTQELKEQSTTMTAARQTMAAWSKLLESREEIPTIFKNHFNQAFGSGEPFPLVIWTPSLDRFPHRTTEKLICDTSDALYIFEKNGNQIDATVYLYRDISGSEVGNILLDSWLTIYGRTKQGGTTASKIEFNTTSKRYFELIIRKLRPAGEANASQFVLQKDKFNALSTINFKFMNYGRESLVAGETVIQFLLQSEIRQPIFTFFSKTFHKVLSPTHLTVLTDQELILIQETGNGKDGRAGRYGGIWQYIPLRYIDLVSLSPVENDRLTFSIRCQPNRTIEKLFDISNLPMLQQFRDQLQALLK